jgi:hypothetical protein
MRMLVLPFAPEPSTLPHVGGQLYDQMGNPVGAAKPDQNVETLVRFSRDQPLATALIALGIGYLLGKML